MPKQWYASAVRPTIKGILHTLPVRSGFYTGALPCAPFGFGCSTRAFASISHVHDGTTPCGHLPAALEEAVTNSSAVLDRSLSLKLRRTTTP